jgi:hypothetical protein
MLHPKFNMREVAPKQDKHITSTLKIPETPEENTDLKTTNQKKKCRRLTKTSKGRIPTRVCSLEWRKVGERS